MNAAVRLLAMLGLAPWTTVPALDYQIHGFISQGFVLSEGNNYYGESTGDGSADFFELGLNATVDAGNGVLLSAQGLRRDAGGQDNGDLRLDYGFVDWRAWSTPESNAGVRAGRVKNPIGFFNDARDVIFTRPGILLPQSVYLDSVGVRGLMFSSDGGQVYGAQALGDHYVTTVVTGALNSGVDPVDFAGGDDDQDFPGSTRFENFWVARVQDEWLGGRRKLALSYLTADMRFRGDPELPFPLAGSLNAAIYILSAHYAGERYAVTGEYSVLSTRGSLGGAPGFSQTFDSTGDGIYVQGDFHLAPHWTAFARYDGSFSDRNDRSGREHERSTGEDRHEQFAHDYVVGLKWLADEHWGIWTEWHSINGTATVPGSDNPDEPRDPNWNMLLLNVAYRF